MNWQIKDTYADGKVVVTANLSEDEARTLLITAQRFVNSGILLECSMLNRNGIEVARVG